MAFVLRSWALVDQIVRLIARAMTQLFPAPLQMCACQAHPHLPLCGSAALSDRLVSARLVSLAGGCDWEVFVRKQICVEFRPRCGTRAKDLERSPQEVLDRWLV
jgi:hypothetical protein